jgi:hypothetical protein
VKDAKAIRTALVWYMLSGMNGNQLAALTAAKIYEQQGAPKEAARWWYRAGQLGDLTARKRFIDLYLKGSAYGIEGKDGANWLTEWALTTRSPSVKLSLGEVYVKGIAGVPNYGEAHRWLMDAALDRLPEAMIRIADLQLHQPAVWRITDKEKDSDNHWTGPSYRAIRLTARDENGMMDLGRSAIAQEESTPIEHVVFLRPGITEAEGWLMRAANLGFPHAKTILGLAKMDGVTLPMDVQEGVWLLSSAACAGDRAALKVLTNFWLDRNPFYALTMAEVSSRNGIQVPQDLWERLNKSLSPRQVGRAKQIAQDWCVQNEQTR